MLCVKPDPCTWFTRSPDGQCIEEVLRRLASGNAPQRRNAIDVISEIIHRPSSSVTLLSPSMWYGTAFDG